MRTRFTFLGTILALALLAVSAGRAAEMPTADDLQAQMGTPAETVTVYELHLSVGDDHVSVDYVGYPAVDVLARLLGADWHTQGDTVELRASDGYVLRVAVDRLLTVDAYLVFGLLDGSPFTEKAPLFHSRSATETSSIPEAMIWALSRTLRVTIAAAAPETGVERLP